jgi:hypothetical protein
MNADFVKNKNYKLKKHRVDDCIHDNRTDFEVVSCRVASPESELGERQTWELHGS